jgi:Zn-dependent protease
MSAHPYMMGRGPNISVPSMGWSIKLFTVGGTAVRMHLTFLLLVAWIAFIEWQRGTPQDAVRGVFFILVLFACVVLHEFGHIWAARRYGIRTPDVTLLPIGGLASMERMPEKPGQEIVVSLAGPAVNAVIAFVILAFLRLDASVFSYTAIQGSFLAQIAFANLVLLVFNLIPAFPMDGGRVLRGVLAIWLGFPRATQVAARIGQGLAILLGIYGLMGNPILVLIAIFVFAAAGGEARYVKLREQARGRTAADAMVAPVEALTVAATAENAAALFARSKQNVAPVVDGAGYLRGIVLRESALAAFNENGPAALKQNRGATPVLELMQSPVATVPESAPLETAIPLLFSSPARWLGVVDASGKLAGYLTPESVRGQPR